MRSDSASRAVFAIHSQAGYVDASNSYRRLTVWHRAIDLAVECDELARLLARAGRASLADQLRRASASVPANIAEGNGRLTRGDYLRHLSIANGSLLEVESHLTLAGRLELIPADRVNRAMDLCGHVGRMLGGLIRALRSPKSESGSRRDQQSREPLVPESGP